MPAAIDDIMEQATVALVAQDYLTAETRCVEALTLARDARDWAYYARVLLPLQEARRQRRMVAADGHIRLGTHDLEGPHADWLGSFTTGCVVVTHPFTVEHAVALTTAVQVQRRCIEVLFADNAVEASVWTIRSFTGPELSVSCDAPPADWVDRWLEPDTVKTLGEPGPEDWFLDASEKLGDAALARVSAEVGEYQRVAQLETMLTVAPDHELLHQHLGEAARALLIPRN